MQEEAPILDSPIPVPARPAAVSLFLVALVAPFGLGPYPAGPERPEIQWNDNEVPAGTLENDTLRIDLEVVRGTWRPLGEQGAPVTVLAFAEVGKAPQIPGPMIRTLEGTEVVVSITNPLDAPLRALGLSSRKHPDRSVGEILRGLELPFVTVQPGETRELRFTADARGTYMYLGRLEDAPGAVEPNEDDLLGGA